MCIKQEKIVNKKQLNYLGLSLDMGILEALNNMWINETTNKGGHQHLSKFQAYVPHMVKTMKTHYKMSINGTNHLVAIHESQVTFLCN